MPCFEKTAVYKKRTYAKNISNTDNPILTHYQPDLIREAALHFKVNCFPGSAGKGLNKPSG